MIYSISYDLNKPGQNYNELFEAIKKCGSSYIRPLKSLWLVDTALSATAIWDRLSAHVDSNDRMLIVRFSIDHSGWLNKDDWAWINTHMAKQTT